MKNLLIIYNVIFLLAGNILFANIHFLNAHNHSHEHSHNHETNECQECTAIENSSNYILDFQEVNFSNGNVNLFTHEHFNIIRFNVKGIYLSRAPPLS